MEQTSPKLLLLLVTSVLLVSNRANSLDTTSSTTSFCVVGGGIAGASLAHFIKHYTCNSDRPNSSCIDDIRIFERGGVVGGRMATVAIGAATVAIGGDTFEAGASIIHPKNLHALRFASMLNLTHGSKHGSESESDSGFGIWDGSRFVFKTLQPPSTSSASTSFIWRKIYSLLNLFRIFRRECWIDSCFTTQSLSLGLCLRRWRKCSSGRDCMNSLAGHWRRN